MKILYTTDLHYNKSWFDWIETQQNKVDIICLTGDFLDASKDDDLITQIEWISNWMKNIQKPLFVCSGNHDISVDGYENWLDKIPNIYSDNQTRTINGVKIATIEYLAPDFLDIDNPDILLYHIPPSKTATAFHKNEEEDWGDRELFRILDNRLFSPNILLCGHIHQPLKTTDKINDTIIYNIGMDKKAKNPNHLIFEYNA